MQCLDHTGIGRWNIHRCFVGLEREQGLFALDCDAGFDQDLDDTHILRIAKIGDTNLDQTHGKVSGAASTLAR